MKQQILDLLCRYAPENATVTEASRLREDLDLNSLSMMMILMESEQTLEQRIDVSALVDAKTVGDLFRALGIQEE